MVPDSQPRFASVLACQKWKLPKRTLLHTFRVNLDWAAILYVRDHVYTEQTEWYGHLRLDSSPQFAKNYLLAELDKVSFPAGKPDLSDLFPGCLSFFLGCFVAIPLVTDALNGEGSACEANASVF